MSKIRGFDIPKYLTLEDWDIWEEETKTKFPTRFYLFWTLPIKFRAFKNNIQDIKWWFFHRLFPKYRFNTVKTGLKPGYYDSDTRILHACFNELNNFIDNCADKIDWKGSSKQHFEAYCTMKQLWYWWNCIRSVEWGELDVTFNFEKENELVLKDNEQLQKLMTIRHFMWC